MMFKLSEAAVLLGAQHLGVDAECLAVSTDSRALRAGDLFVALRGDRFDGHDFVSAVSVSGAAGALVAFDAVDSVRQSAPDLPLLVVEDTRLALGQLAAHWRARFALPVLAVTGSNGKTTTKEMLAAIFRQVWGDAVLVTEGNLNNDIGLPLTLLRLRPEHRVAIVEMGMSHPGEIARLTALAAPTVAVVTNAQQAHLEGLGSLQAIALEKGSIYEGLSADGVAVINADDPHATLWRESNVLRRQLSFGIVQAADVTARVRLHGLETHLFLSWAESEAELVLGVPGVHNARNALAAAAVSLAAGVSFEQVVLGLRAFRGVKRRLQCRAGLRGAVVLDDTYNANPDSVRAGIDVLAATVGRKIFVLGDMGEIGSSAAQSHDEMGGYAKSAGVDALYALGELSAVAARNFAQGAHHYKRVEDLIADLQAELAPDVTVLVKGSRFMKMERVADAIVLPLEEAKLCC